MSSQKSVIIIPTYNEKDNVPQLTSQIFHFIPQTDILFIDDNSPDGTQMVVDKLMKEFPLLNILKRKGKEGLGKAYTEAFRLVLKDSNISTIITMDADLQDNPIEIPKLIKIKSNASINTRSFCKLCLMRAIEIIPPAKPAMKYAAISKKP